MKTTKNTKVPLVVTKYVSPETTGKEVKAKSPKPRVLEANRTVINTNNLPTNPTPKKNQKYSYDALGNIQGFDIAPRDLITSEDSVEERNIKIARQQATLPCNGPKPRLK